MDTIMFSETKLLFQLISFLFSVFQTQLDLIERVVVAGRYPALCKRRYTV